MQAGDKIRLVLLREVQVEAGHVEVDHVQQRGGGAVVEVRGSRGQPALRNRSHVPHSGSFGLLKRTVNFMLPCPHCGKLGAPGFPGSKLEAVSSMVNYAIVPWMYSCSYAYHSLP